MTIKKLNDGRYEVDIRPNGKSGKRVRRIFNRKSEATAFERYTIVNAKKFAGDPDHSERLRLEELLDKWWLYYGQTLKNGLAEKRQLTQLIRDLGNPTINQLTKQAVLEYRGWRLSDGVSPATINRDLYRLSGMFTTLKTLDFFNLDNPLKGLPKLKERKSEVTFLSHEEIKKLLSLLDGDNKKVALLCLSTGARWSEAATLKAEQVRNGRVTFLQTKNGRMRVIPISSELEGAIKTKQSGKLFDVNYRLFREILKEAKPDLPKGQSTHVMRHSFASHFIMNGGSIVALKEILGHATIQQTMVYAHLASDYMQLVVSLNPINCVKV